MDNNLSNTYKTRENANQVEKHQIPEYEIAFEQIINEKYQRDFKSNIEKIISYLI